MPCSTVSVVTSPPKTVTPKKKNPLWIDAELQLLIIEKNALHRQFDRTKRVTLLEKFISLCDELFNASFACGIFPTSSKRAKLLALKKATVPSTIDS